MEYTSGSIVEELEARSKEEVEAHIPPTEGNKEVLIR